MIQYLIVPVSTTCLAWPMITGDGRDGSGGGEVEGECAGRDIWNWGTFRGHYGNLVQCKVPGIYESDPSDGGEGI